MRLEIDQYLQCDLIKCRLSHFAGDKTKHFRKFEFCEGNMKSNRANKKIFTKLLSISYLDMKILLNYYQNHKLSMHQIGKRCRSVSSQLSCAVCRKSNVILAEPTEINVNWCFAPSKMLKCKVHLNEHSRSHRSVSSTTASMNLWFHFLEAQKFSAKSQQTN